MKTPLILLGTTGLLVTVSVMVRLDSPNGYIIERSRPPQSTGTGFSQNFLPAGAAAMAPARREEDLRQWADAMELGAMGDALERLGSVTDEARRSAAQQALLSSWAERDLTGLTAWFGERYAADDIHQQTRDMLAQAFARCEPDTVLAWMESGLRASVRQELEGPFFRAWAKTEPSVASAKLYELASASPDDPRWGDLLGQVAALWAGTDVERAVDWAQSLEDGAAKTAALQAVGYRWTETRPQAAAAYAAQQGDADLLRLAAGKWAEIDPRAAAAWVQGLPAGEARDGALAQLMSTWNQKDSYAAAAYAAGLPAGGVRDQAVLAAALNWTYTDPARAADWIGRFPESPLRTQALERLMSVWTHEDTSTAGRWLNALPASPSRDAAMAAYHAAIGSLDLSAR
jgi:hypothetical protein